MLQKLSRTEFIIYRNIKSSKLLYNVSLGNLYMKLFTYGYKPSCIKWSKLHYNI